MFHVFSNFVVEIKEHSQQSAMHNLFAKFGKILDVCKSLKDLVNENGTHW